MLRPCALERGELGVAVVDPELLRALVPGDARSVGIGLDALRADFVDEVLIVGRRDHQRRLAAARLGRAAEIGAGAGEIADIDHLLAMGDEILDAVALVWRGGSVPDLGSGAMSSRVIALARIVPSAAIRSTRRSEAPVGFRQPGA